MYVSANMTRPYLNFILINKYFKYKTENPN